MQPPLSGHPRPATAHTGPTSHDVFASFPQAPGTLAAAVQERLGTQAVLVPQHVQGFDDEPRMQMRPYRDPLGWHLVKHLVQLALITSVVLFAARGGDGLVGLGYMGTALLLMLVVVLADRMRFADRDPSFEIVEFLAPAPRPEPVPQPRIAPLVPLVEQMHVALGDRVDVT